MACFPHPLRTYILSSPTWTRCLPLLWRQFCVHQFLTQALEELLYSVLEVISSAASPPTVDDVIESLQTGLSSLLRKVTGRSCKTPQELFLACGISQIPDQETSESLQQRLSLRSPLNEMKALEFGEKTPVTAVARALLLLAILYGKSRGIKQDSGFTYLLPISPVTGGSDRFSPGVTGGLRKTRHGCVSSRAYLKHTHSAR